MKPQKTKAYIWCNPYWKQRNTSVPYPTSALFTAAVEINGPHEKIICCQFGVLRSVTSAPVTLKVNRWKYWFDILKVRFKMSHFQVNIYLNGYNI